MPRAFRVAVRAAEEYIDMKSSVICRVRKESVCCTYISVACIICPGQTVTSSSALRSLSKLSKTSILGRCQAALSNQ